jgi:hypothetical protein
VHGVHGSGMAGQDRRLDTTLAATARTSGIASPPTKALDLPRGRWQRIAMRALVDATEE